MADKENSVWVFLLLSAEVMKQHKTTPKFRCAIYIPPFSNKSSPLTHI